MQDIFSLFSLFRSCIFALFFYTFLHFKCRFSTVLPNNCFRDSIIRHPTCFVNKGKVNSRNFTYDGPTFSAF